MLEPIDRKYLLAYLAGIKPYGSFTSESHARDFMHLLAQLVQAKDETNGGDDNG